MSGRLARLQEIESIDPRSIPNLVGWWDSRYINGFTGSQPSDGAAISQWNDLSGHGYHMLQASAVDRPTYDATSKSVNFSALNHFLECTTFPTQTSLTVYACFRLSLTNPSSGSSPIPRIVRFIGSLINSGWSISPQLLINTSTTTPRFFSYDSATVATISSAISYPTDTSAFYIAGGSLIATKNGVQAIASTNTTGVASSPSSSSSNARTMATPSLLFSTSTLETTQTHFQGYLSDVLIYADAHMAPSSLWTTSNSAMVTSRHRIMKWLAAKRNVTLNN